MNTNLRTPRVVLISGCSSGIGRAIAVDLVEHGYRVLAGVRLDADAESLDALGYAELRPVRLDVTSDDSVNRLLGEVDAWHPQGIDALVNNAGVGLPSAVELTTPEEFRDLLEVNTVGPLRLIRSCLPRLRKREGRIVNITSLNGTVALPMIGAYSATKHALEAMSDTLRVELRPWGVIVVSVAPGQVLTPVFDKARVAINDRRKAIPATLRPGYGSLYRRALKYNERGARASTSAEDVAKVVRIALTAKRPRPRYHVGADSFGVRLLKKVAPTFLFDRVIARLAGVFHRIKSHTE
ncbi:MAG: SDR family oxidoreductase [Planctomycetota bacterium]